MFIKRKLRNLKSIILLTLLSLFAACGSSENDEVTPNVEVKFNTPNIGQEFNLGQDVNFDIDLTSENEFYGYEFIVYYKNSKAQVFKITDETPTKNTKITHSWTNNVSGHNDMIIEINVFIDKEGNTITKERGFHCHPF